MHATKSRADLLASIQAAADQAIEEMSERGERVTPLDTGTPASSPGRADAPPAKPDASPSLEGAPAWLREASDILDSAEPAAAERSSKLTKSVSWKHQPPRTVQLVKSKQGSFGLRLQSRRDDGGPAWRCDA